MVRWRLRDQARDGGPGNPGPGNDAATLRWCREIVSRVGDCGPRLAALSDGELRGLTTVYRGRLTRGESLDELLPEAFAAVRAAADRTLGQRHFDVQIMGGAVLHLGKIAEKRTGEGKTLTATLPAYLRGLTGAGVHVMTANAHLANRDAGWMRPVYELLGMTVGLPGSAPESDTAARRAAYAADVTYGTAMEFACGYLRDNLATETRGLVQRGRHSALVDEADLILIDEMRTVAKLTAASGPV